MYTAIHYLINRPFLSIGILMFLIFVIDIIFIAINNKLSFHDNAWEYVKKTSTFQKISDYFLKSPINKAIKKVAKSNRINFLLQAGIVSFIFWLLVEGEIYDYSKVTTKELSQTVDSFKKEVNFDSINHIYLIDETASTKEPIALINDYKAVIDYLNEELATQENEVITNETKIELKRYLVGFLLENLHRKDIKGNYFVGKMGENINPYNNNGVLPITPSNMRKTVIELNKGKTNENSTEFKSVFADLKNKIINDDKNGYWIINIFSDFYNDKWVSYEIQSTLNDLCQNQKRKIEFNLITLPTKRLYPNNEKINKLLELIQNSACDCSYVTYDIPLMVHQYTMKKDSSFLRLQLESLNVPTINIKDYGRPNELFFKYNNKKRKYGIIVDDKGNSDNSLIYFAATHSETDKRALIECDVSSRNKAITKVEKRIPINEFTSFLLAPEQTIELKIVRGKITDEEAGIVFYQQQQKYKFFIPVEQDYNN
jgi:hypothetical protein